MVKYFDWKYQQLDQQSYLFQKPYLLYSYSATCYNLSPLKLILIMANLYEVTSTMLCCRFKKSNFPFLQHWVVVVVVG